LRVKNLAVCSVGSEIYATVLSVPNVRWIAEEGKAMSICSSRMLSVHGKLGAEAKWVIELCADGDFNIKKK